MTKITLVKDDITVQKVDAIVNAANNSLRGGGGVDGAIHRAAGDDLFEECVLLEYCETGEAKITGGYKLFAKHIIHTVGPVYGFENGKEIQLLKSCYQSVLKLAMKHGIKTIAFPGISIGVFRYPISEATKIAIDTVQDFIIENPDIFEEIRFVVFSDDIFKIYSTFLDTCS